MRRRRLLTGIGAATAVSAGCLGAGPSGDAGPSADGDATEGKTDSDEAEPTESDDESCSPYPTDRDRAVCSHTVDGSSASVFLDPDPETVGLDGGEPADPVTLTLHNRSAADLEFNPNSWRIRHDPGDGWTELGPEVSGDGVVTVSAGETYTWSFTEAIESIWPEPELGPGRYAVEIGVPDPAGTGWLGCIALLRLECR